MDSSTQEVWIADTGKTGRTKRLVKQYLVLLHHVRLRHALRLAYGGGSRRALC